MKRKTLVFIFLLAIVPSCSAFQKTFSALLPAFVFIFAREEEKNAQNFQLKTSYSFPEKQMKFFEEKFAGIKLPKILDSTDTDKNGMISYLECWKQTLPFFLKFYLRQKDFLESSLDHNSDGLVTSDEYGKLQPLFSRFDFNQDNSLDHAEMDSLQFLFLPILFKKNTILFQNYFSAEFKLKLPQSGLLHFFVDLNNDGKVTGKEWTKVLRNIDLVKIEPVVTVKVKKGQISGTDKKILISVSSSQNTAVTNASVSAVHEASAGIKLSTESFTAIRTESGVLIPVKENAPQKKTNASESFEIQDTKKMIVYEEELPEVQFDKIFKPEELYYIFPNPPEKDLEIIMQPASPYSERIQKKYSGDNLW
ncbi:MAG: hypothetical protein HQM10_04250 [Candidatus Riflebacteria bacterium]|nr:hypothetical protein [Candidatus Riflebacteria bacterium]